MSEPTEATPPHTGALNIPFEASGAGDGEASSPGGPDGSAPRRVRTARAPRAKEGPGEGTRRTARPRAPRRPTADAAEEAVNTAGNGDSISANVGTPASNITASNITASNIADDGSAEPHAADGRNGPPGDNPRSAVARSPQNGRRSDMRRDPASLPDTSTGRNGAQETARDRPANAPEVPAQTSSPPSAPQNEAGNAPQGNPRNAPQHDARNARRGGPRPEKYVPRNRPPGDRGDSSHRRKPQVVPRGPLATNTPQGMDSGNRTAPNRSSNRPPDRGRDSGRPNDGGRRPSRTSREPQGRGPSQVSFRPPQPAQPLAPTEVQAAKGILEVRHDGNGFLRTRDNWIPDAADVSVPANLIEELGLRAGQEIIGAARPNGRSGVLVSVLSAEGQIPARAKNGVHFTSLEAEIPFERMRLETTAESIGPRLIDLLAPIGKGQRGLIVAPPQAGKTRLLRDIAHSVATNHPKTELFILLIDERPEEVTELRSLRLGKVIASTFDETRTGHLAAAELALERMYRLVESGRDVFLLIDSLTRLARASNLSIRGSGRSLSGGLDPAALAFPRRLFGAARATRDAGSLTILATALVETGSVMDEFVFQEFKGTGNWEVKLDRKLAQRRIFPAIDINASSTRREELLYTPQELQATTRLRQYLHKFSQQAETRAERLVWLLSRTRSNAELLSLVDRL